MDLGLLIVRAIVGTSMLLFHGWGKLSGGPERWASTGGAMENLGITFLPVMWGFLAACSESIGSVLLTLGILVRPAAVALATTMLVAIARHLSLPAGEPGSGWDAASHALELLAVYVALLLAGPGRYALRLGRPTS
ncbi:MAG: DoxX family protein [bacterium]